MKEIQIYQILKEVKKFLVMFSTENYPTKLFQTPVS